MIGKRLEALIANECRKTDMSFRADADLVQRFQKLRDFGVLPKSRGKNARQLSAREIVGGLLSVVSVKPGFAGLSAKVLSDLRPVGGPDASFRKAETFGAGIASLLTSPGAVEGLIEVRASDSEIYTNGHGLGAIVFQENGPERTSYYVGRDAYSLLQPGREAGYNPRQLMSSVITEMVFYPRFFQRIARELEREERYGRPLFESEDDETDEEREREERYRRLGVGPGSRFLNIGIDTQVTWPKEETVVAFEGKQLVLMPKTKDNMTSMHIDLHRNRLSDEDAITLANRFLSLMSWCSDQFAINHMGWSGNPVPVAVPKPNLAFSTTPVWIFDRKIPDSEEAKKALAIYREARNAQQNHMVSYAVLGFYKIIEIKHRGSADARKWFKANYAVLSADPIYADEIAHFEKARGTELPQDYLYRACRTAVAHANKPFSVDPDRFDELRRLHVAADVLRALARRFIEKELRISDCMFDGS